MTKQQGGHIFMMIIYVLLLSKSFGEIVEVLSGLMVSKFGI